MIHNFYLILLPLTVILGLVSSAPCQANDDLVHEYIPQEDGTVDHFAYHSSFVGDYDIKLNSTMVGTTNAHSTALEKHDLSGLSAALNELGISDNIRHVLLHQLDSTIPSGNDTNDSDPVELLDKPFIGSNSYQNASFCGFPAPFPDWNSLGFLNRPDTYDCVRLLEMWFHKPGYFQLSQFGGTSATDWSFLTLYNSCEMDVRRLDFENQWGARVGSFDIMKWVVAAMLVSIGKDYENPEVFKYMASISGSIGCSQATQTPTKTPLPATLSSWISQTTPEVFPLGALGTVTVTPSTSLPDTTITSTIIPRTSMA